MCDSEKICPPQKIDIQSSVERDRLRFEHEYNLLMEYAKNTACSIWYDDQKKKNSMRGWMEGSTSDYRVAAKVVEAFRLEGWQCKVTDTGLHRFAIEFYNPKMKPSWWWRTF